MKISAEKPNVMYFRKSQHLETEKFFPHIIDRPILEVNSYKYLGILLDSHLKFYLCINALAESSGRTLSATITKFKSLKNVGHETFTKLFQCGVQPIMEYGSSIWGDKDAHK